jgi:putative FmdB family regulatory protein
MPAARARCRVDDRCPGNTLIGTFEGRQTAWSTFMPIFEYHCSACGTLEEVLQKHGAPAPERCARCQAEGTMNKALSLAAFHLKGGGWYKDLYSSASGDSPTAAAGSAAPAAPAAATAPAPSATPAPAAPAASPTTPSSTSST